MRARGEQAEWRGPRAACPPLFRPCSPGVSVKTLLLVGFPELLQLREEGLRLAADGRAAVQRPWGGQSTRSCYVAADWPRRRGHSALASQSTCFACTEPRTDLEGTLHSLRPLVLSQCMSTLTRIQLYTQKNTYKPPATGETLFSTCWGKSSELDKVPPVVRLMVATDEPATTEICDTSANGDTCQEREEQGGGARR